MKTSDSIKNIAEAMAAASNNIGAAVKGKDNPFFKTKYADLGSVIMAFKDAVLAEGLSYIQLPITVGSQVGVVTRLMHVSGEWIEEEFTVPTAKQDPQAAGSAITYCRRYALAALFGIPTADNDAEAAMYRGKAELPEGAAKALEDAESLEALSGLFKEAWKEYPDNRLELTIIKDAKKKELSSD